MLSGKTIAVTRPKGQEKSFLRLLLKHGARAVHCPLILLSPCLPEKVLRESLKNLHHHDWICFTSANGVRYAFDFAARENLLLSFRNAKVACIGTATANALKRRGISPALVPDYYQAEGLLEAFAREGISGKKFLLLRAKGSREVLREVLAREGGDVTEIFLYEALPDIQGMEKLKKALLGKEINCVTFTSSSTVHAFWTLLEEKSIIEGVVLASIGPITSASLREKGLRPDLEAKTYTTEGLVHAICEHYKERQFTANV